MESFLFTTLTIALLSLSACEEPAVDITNPDINPGTPPASQIGHVTPVGTPEGAVITATIGPTGGNIESADKRIRIIIPAGALSSNQTITVQPIINNCPAGTGRAFRLTPHGLTFAKPATIAFQYDEQDVNGSAPEVLRVAYQGDNGAWKSPGVKGLDTTANTVSIQTTHFSDWGLFQTMHVSPSQSFLNPGEHVHLTVYQTFTEGVEEDLFVPLPTRIPAKYIDKWAYQGVGTLTHQHNTGDYYAPASIPTLNPETATVFLNKSVTIDRKVYKDLRLVANFFVAPEGVSIQVNGGGWQTYPGGANINGTHNVVLTNTAGGEYVNIGWKGKPTGTYHWVSGTDAYLNYAQGKLIYQHIYGKGIPSGGALRVNNENRDWVLGTFTVTTAGWIDTAPIPATMGTATLRGVFRVKRVN